MSDIVRVFEVGPRDGLQNESVPVGTQTRVDLIERLTSAGVRRLEAGSFVSPKAVPQMAGTAEVLQALRPSPGVTLSVLVPNIRGMESAVNAGIREVAVFASASETFSQRNIGCSIEESFARFEPVMAIARDNGIAVRGYVSCVLGCPYEGEIALGSVVGTSQRLAAMGCYEISLGDTIGIGTAGSTRRIFGAVCDELGHDLVAGHFHDTRGQALANVLACLDMGIRSFDSSVAGLGGCPYAPGASGNLASEDLVYMLDGLGMETGINLDLLADAGDFISGALGRPTGSRVGKALHGVRRAARAA